jgi:hypothetical protein
LEKEATALRELIAPKFFTSALRYAEILWRFYAPTVLASITRAGELVEASSLSLPAAEKGSAPVISPRARRKLTDGEVNTAANTSSHSIIERRTGRIAKGKIDNRRITGGHSMIYSSVDSTDNITGSA